GIVEPKGDDHGDLVGYVSIVAEEVQDLRIFKETIESNSDQTRELIGLLEVVGCKGSLMLQLLEPPKIPEWVWSQAILREDGRHSGGRRMVKLVGLSKTPMIVGNKRFFRRTNLAAPGPEEGAVNLVGATKHPMVLGGKIFMRAESIPRDEGEEQLVGSKWRMVPRSRFKWDLDLAGNLE
ncbi:hypothetical protein L195_g052422, partial [Trifolium pratense]